MLEVPLVLKPGKQVMQGTTQAVNRLDTSIIERYHKIEEDNENERIGSHKKVH